MDAGPRGLPGAVGPGRRRRSALRRKHPKPGEEAGSVRVWQDQRDFCHAPGEGLHQLGSGLAVGLPDCTQASVRIRIAAGSSAPTGGG